MMTVPEILKELEPYTGRFPMEAMEAAIEQREAITPELLRVVDSVAEDPTAFAARQDYMLHLFAIFLLAQFRERRAYPAIVKMFSAPGETPFDLAGDTVTEGLSQIFASVYDGNPAPLHGLVESEEVNEFVRNAALNAFLVREHTGLMPRAEVVEYLRSLFQGRLKREPSYAWDSLVCAVADLPAPEPWRREGRTLITDAINEMEWWVSFHPEDSRASEPAQVKPPAPLPPPPPPVEDVATQPFVRQPRVGRNDPCPCGSGKKYKKCCGKG